MSVKAYSVEKGKQIEHATFTGSYPPRGGGLLCPQPTRMYEYKSDEHGSVFGSK